MGADEISPAYRLMVVTGVIGLLILSVGVFQFVHYEPLGQKTGLHARIVGIYAYDAQSGQVSGGNLDHIGTGKPFAARVDWTSLPATTQVVGHWFVGGFAIDVGGAGPAAAGSLPEVVPATPGHEKLPAGHITFVVERWSGGRAVEVLGRKSIVVAGP